jgi:hypothetical protein
MVFMIYTNHGRTIPFTVWGAKMSKSNNRSRGLLLAGLLLISSLLFLAGCMSVRYDRMTPATAKAKGSENYGVPFYEGRPYLLVVNGFDAKGKPSRTVSVITLPDHSKPYRAYIDGWLGKAALTVNLSNGVLTSTTASGEESFSGLLTAAAGAAVVPANIANTNAQAALTRAQTKTTLAELQGIVERDDDCLAKPATNWWYSEMMRIKGRILSARTADLDHETKKVADKLADWNKRVCASLALNFKAEPNAHSLRQIEEFQKALKPFITELGGFEKDIANIAERNGCKSEKVDSSCQPLQAATSSLSLLAADMKKFLPVEPATLPPFELYEFEYDETNGAFKGLKKRYPAS